MPAERIVVHDAIVLKLSPSGERFRQVKLIAPEQGMFSLLLRLRSKRPGPQLDLFDECEASLDLKQGERHNEGFLQEFSVTRKRSGIGASYPLLKAAAWISGLFLSHPLHEENSQESYQLARKALDALDKGFSPPAIQLKTLFVFCRSEGYPILEDWANKLDSSLAAPVIQILNTPLESLELDPKLVEASFDSIRRYVEHNTHLSLPTS